MRRRSFLLSGGGGLLVMLGPGWLRRAFGDASLKGAVVKEDPRFGDVARRRALAKAKARALAAGRPLLVFIIPKDDDQKWDRGHAFGELLTHGTPAQLAPLASAELACATLDDLGAHAPAKADPLLARLDPKTNALHLIDASEPLPTLAQINWRGVRVKGHPEPSPDEIVDHRIAILSVALKEALGPARAPELGKQVAARYLRRPPDGTHWANDSACGPARVEETVEERVAREAEEKRQAALGIFTTKTIVGYGCGMGFLPDKSQRFLYFFTKDPDA
jgi:hypothetical protein